MFLFVLTLPSAVGERDPQYAGTLIFLNVFIHPTFQH